MKSGTDPIPAELIQAGSNTICSEIHIWNKEKFPEKWKEPIIVPIYKEDDKTKCINYPGKSLLSTTYKILPNILLSRLTTKLLRIISMDFNIN
jgi:hypothetical protein